MTGLLPHPLPCFEQIDLAPRFVLDGASEGPQRVEVLDLAPRPERRDVVVSHGNVGVDTHRTFLHARVGHLGGQQDVAQLAHILTLLLGPTKVWPAHDLDERHAGAVVVDQRIVGAVDAAVATDVRALAGVLLDVRPLDAHPDA